MSDSDFEDDQIEQNLIRPIRFHLRAPILNMNLNDQGVNIPPVPQPAIYPAGFHMSILNEIPRYEGNPSELSEYTRSVQDIFDQFHQPQDPNAYINKLLLSAARNRLKGPALEVVTGQTILTWEELRTILIDNFGDQRSELNLVIDLTRLKQNFREHPVDFYNRCRSLVAILNSKISLTNDIQEIKNYRIANAKALALKSFTSGLMEPLGSFLRSRAPATLENALTIVKEELDVRYFQNLQNKPQTSVQQPIKIPQRPHPTFQNYPILQPRAQQNQFPQQARQYQPNVAPITHLNPNQPPAQFPGYQKPFGKPGQNVFAPKRNFQPSKKPEPMDMSTIKKRPASQQVGNFRQRPFNQASQNYSRFQPGNSSTNHFTNNGQRPNFTFEELHNMNTEPQQDSYDQYVDWPAETDNTDYSEYPEYHDEQCDMDDYQNYNQEDFQTEASEPQTN